MNVVLYLRYSSDKQTEQSIEGQQRICTEYCDRNGLKIVDIYVDRALSASKNIEKRTEFQRMIKDSEKGTFEAVIVYKLDRFSRNRYDSATYKNKLKKNGVKVISATENISDNPEGVILESLLEGMAEYYSRELAQKVTRGMNETALKGNSCGGTIPLGYKIENKKYVIDTDTASLVKEIFTRFNTGERLMEIANDFNGRGLRTSTGSKFNKNSFQNLLKNEKYIGVYKYKDIRIEGAVPRIIDDKLFQEVQTRIMEQKKAPRKAKANVDFQLSGKLICGHCNTFMQGDSGTSENGKTYYYYSCPQKKNKKTCDKKSVQKDLIEKLIVEDAISLLTPENIEKLADAAVKQAEKDRSENVTLSNLKKELNKIERSTANLLTLVERGSDSEQLFARLQELEQAKKDIRLRIDSTESEFVTIEKPQIIWFLNKFADGDPNDPDYRRRVIDILINSVTIWDEPDGYRFTTVYNLTSLKTKTTKLTEEDIKKFESMAEWFTKKTTSLGLSFFTYVLPKKTTA